MKSFWFFFVVFLLAAPAWADCKKEEYPDARMSKTGMPIVKILVKSCRALDPDKEEKLVKYEGVMYGFTDRAQFMNTYFRGALIENPQGHQYVYPTDKAEPCAKFPTWEWVEVQAPPPVCCDTGYWGKCLFGGYFLQDIDAKPLDMNQ